jgi:hypothetical protein
MATTFKPITSGDVISTRTKLHEAIPVTGSIVSGSYADNNIKNYAHGMFQSVFDYPYLSSSANHIFDLTCGYSVDSELSGGTSTQNSKKVNIYNEMAQVLCGFNTNSRLHRFDQDGVYETGTKINDSYFFNFTRLLSKDEIKKGSFELQLGVSASYETPFAQTVLLKDTNGINNFRINSPAGEYGILYVTNGDGSVALNGITGSTEQPAGLIYYQAGIAVVTASVFGSLLSASEGSAGIMSMSADGAALNEMLSGSTIQANADALRHRIQNVSFNNTVELNSTVYFCRANHNEFNFSANPTYVSESKMVVKNNADDLPVSYVTTVGLYSPTNELLAVAKLSEPLKKDPTTEFTLRVRLDY